MLLRTGLFLAIVSAQVVANGSDPAVEVLQTGSRSGSARIVDGWDAHPGQLPHHAALRHVARDGSVATCGGALIAKQWLLTAAYCTASRVAVVVALGVANLTRPQHLVEAEAWFHHPSFRELPPEGVQYNDIGLVKLPLPVVYTRVLQRICVQPSSDAFRSYENEVMYTSGHGRLWMRGPESEVLQWVYQRAVADRVCRIDYPQVVIENTICAIFYNDSLQTPCVGDGGGPLVHVDSEGVPILVGIASFRSANGCLIGWYTSFVRPGPFHAWFTEVTGIDFENLVEEDDVIVTTPPPEEKDEDPTTLAPTTPINEYEPTTEPPLSTESGESLETEENEGSGDETEEIFDSESDESPSGSLIIKKIQMKVKLKVNIRKEVRVKKGAHIKKEHLPSSRFQGIVIQPILY